MILLGNALTKGKGKKSQQKDTTCDRHTERTNEPNIDPPMPFNLRNIRQPTHRKLEKLPIRRPRDRFPDGGLPHSWRAHETYDFALDRSAEFTDCEEFEDAVFDVFEAVVVFV
jgi:hypothetical protein